MYAESEKLFREFKLYAEHDETIYKHLNLALYYAYQHEAEESLVHLKQFSEAQGINYLHILFLEMDPLFDPVKDLPQFGEILQAMKAKSREEREAIRNRLREKGLI